MSAIAEDAWGPAPWLSTVDTEQAADADPPVDGDPPDQLHVDIAALLADGLPTPPVPAVLCRTDGHALFYTGKVNQLFGDPECGKTWIALAACVEQLRDQHRASVMDLDHNGPGETVTRLLALGARPDDLSDPQRFRYYEPEDKEHLMNSVAALREWRPHVVVLDSVGELLPMLGLSSSNPDEYTAANRATLTALANTGACVIAIDHLPKDVVARAAGATGTVAKKRAVNGVSLRVTLADTFVRGRGGAANLTIAKDRPGGVREHSPGAKDQPAGRFVMDALAGEACSWRITSPRPQSDTTDSDDIKASVRPEDIAELDALDPPPRSSRDVQTRCQWGSDRATKALKAWRATCSS